MNIKDPGNYGFETLIRENTEESRLFYNEHHFLSIINEDGAFIIRPHPHYDVNSWGSSLYLQPFLSDGIIANARINPPVLRSKNISISALGKLLDDKKSLGQWAIDLSVMFDDTTRSVKGEGKYSVKLEDSIKYLNICKIASNYLTDVPLLTGSYGNTGDLLYAKVSGDDSSFVWYPHLQPGHFPQEPSQKIEVLVAGNYNAIDTKFQGYERIEPSLKPSITVIFESENIQQFLFGGIYNQIENKQFWSDNVGITLLMKKLSPEFSINFSFLSQII